MGYKFEKYSIGGGSSGVTIIEVSATGEMQQGEFTVTAEQLALLGQNPASVALKVNLLGASMVCHYNGCSADEGMYMFTSGFISDLEYGYFNLIANIVVESASGIYMTMQLTKPTTDTAGIIKAEAKTDADTVPCRVGDDGKLYVEPSGGASEEEVVQIVKTNFEGGVGYEESGVLDLIPEQTVTFAGGPWFSPSYIPLEVGNTYTFTFNGTAYQVTAKTLTREGEGEYIYLGNGVPLGGEASDEPFLVVSIVSMNMSAIMGDDGEYTISLSGEATVQKKIDAKFLDTIGAKGTGYGAEVFNGGAAGNASGMMSHAEGISTKATGDYSHAEGSSTIANGINAHAEGEHTVANSRNAHAEGMGTIASSFAQHVQGRYNIENSAETYAHIVGNGEGDTSRSNAYTLDWDGNAWFAGKVKVGGTGYNDPNAVEIGGSGGGLEFVCDLVKSDVGLEIDTPCIALNFPENSGLSLEANTQYVLTFILGGYVDYAYDFYWFGASTYSQRDFPILIESGNPATTGLVTISLGYSQSTFANMFMYKSTGENVVSQFYDYIQNIKLYKRK